jgi:small subunit ribosomal protein S8
MVTDTIGDFIIKIKNSNLARKDLVTLYNSKMNLAIAETLAKAGFIKSVSKAKGGKMLDIALEYKADKSPKITNVSRVSKPSRRVYKKSSEIKPFKNGLGAIVISTPKGVISNKEAFKQKVGGEVLFKIW